MRAIDLMFVIWCGAFGANAIGNGTTGSLTLWQDDNSEDSSGFSGVRKTQSTPCSTKKDCKKHCNYPKGCKKVRCKNGECKCSKCATSNAQLSTSTDYLCSVQVTCMCGGNEKYKTDLTVDIGYREKREGDAVKTINLPNQQTDSQSYKWENTYKIIYYEQFQPELNFEVYDDDPVGRQILGETGFVGAQKQGEHFITLKKYGIDCPVGDNGKTHPCYQSKPKLYFSCDMIPDYVDGRFEKA